MTYFNYDRKRFAIEDLDTCYKCAKKAGIKDKLFINFGLLLGVVRENDFIGHDNDVDVCVKSDGITNEQQEAYIRYLEENEMFMARERYARRKDNGFILWFSLRKRLGRAKFCHWWGFEWENYWWWSKGRKWVRPSKFNQTRWDYNSDDEAIALGIPAEYIKNLMIIKFKKINIQIPEKYGSVLDWEYPGWPIPRGGSSRKQAVCIINKWDNPRSWKISLPY